MSTLLSFPNPVNEKTARSVAGGVLVLSLLALIPGLTWLTLPIAIGFALRVASGPRFSPLGQFASRVVSPRLGAPRMVAGPPKRFAQAIGLTVTGAAAIAYLGFGATGVAQILLVLIVVAAGLESIAGICLGCIIFARLMAAGLIAEDTCEACRTVGLRYSQNG